MITFCLEKYKSLFCFKVDYNFKEEKSYEYLNPYPRALRLMKQCILNRKVRYNMTRLCAHPKTAVRQWSAFPFQFDNECDVYFS